MRLRKRLWERSCGKRRFGIFLCAVAKRSLFGRFSNMFCYFLTAFQLRSKPGERVGNQTCGGLIRRVLRAREGMKARALRFFPRRRALSPQKTPALNGYQERRETKGTRPGRETSPVGFERTLSNGLSGPPWGSSSEARSSRRCCGRTSRARRPFQRLRPRGRGRPRAHMRGFGASGRPCRTRGPRPSGRP